MLVSKLMNPYSAQSLAFSTASALFVALYDLFQQFDDNLTDDGQIKKYDPYLNAFDVVNRLRKDRAKMVKDHETYKLLHLCLSNYGANRDFFNDLPRMKTSKRSKTSKEVKRAVLKPKTAQKANHQKEAKSTDVSKDVEYVYNTNDSADSNDEYVYNSDISGDYSVEYLLSLIHI